MYQSARYWHGVSRGIIGSLRGGSFKSGFLSGLVGSIAGGFIEGAKFLQKAGPFAQYAATTIAGGAASAAGGGKFANGAISAAFVYIFNDAIEIWSRDAEFPWPFNKLKHYWIKTDKYEAGMGQADGDVPAQDGEYDMLYTTRTKTADHSGQSDRPGSQKVWGSSDSVYTFDVDCVNNKIQPGQDTGRFSGFNNCQTFSWGVLSGCRAQ